MNNPKKKIHQKDLALNNQIQFCSECGEDLTPFGLNGEVENKKVNERFKKCKSVGRFKGDLCSMIFISDSNEPPKLNDDEEL